MVNQIPVQLIPENRIPQGWGEDSVHSIYISIAFYAIQTGKSIWSSEFISMNTKVCCCNYIDIVIDIIISSDYSWSYWPFLKFWMSCKYRVKIWYYPLNNVDVSFKTKTWCLWYEREYFFPETLSFRQTINKT